MIYLIVAHKTSRFIIFFFTEAKYNTPDDSHLPDLGDIFKSATNFIQQRGTTEQSKAVPPNSSGTT